MQKIGWGTFAALALLAVAACKRERQAPAPKASSSASSAHVPRDLRTCTRKQQTPDSVTLFCKGFAFKVMELQRIPTDYFLELMQRQGSAEGFSKTRLMKVGGLLVNVVESWTGKGDVRRLTLSGELLNERLGSCYGEPGSSTQLEDCEAAFRSLHDPRTNVRVEIASPNLALPGKTLSTPAGCRQMGGQVIECSDAELHVRYPLTAASDPQREFEVLLESLGKFEVKDVPCRLLGKRERCKRYELRPSAGGPTAVTYLRLPRGLADYAAQCNLKIVPGKSFPAPCDQVFEGKPP